MNEDFNPTKIPEDSKVDAESSLADALEKLIEGRFSGPPLLHPDHAGLSPEPRRSFLRDAETSACPDPGDLALVLNYEPNPPERAKIDAVLAHVAACGICAERLRMLSADVSEEETAELGELDCRSVLGQQRLAAELAQTPRAATGRRTPRLYLWAGAGMAASLMIAVGLTSWWRLANNPDRLLAQAYTESRPFDLRMPGAGFAEVTPRTHLRGGSTGRESAKLLDARARIERKLEAAPEDGHWLQLEARADILEEKFDPAIDILDRLAAAGPVTASLLLDDASAYFQRGTATDSENDRAQALDALRRADELAPGDPIVLFNEAVVMEDRGQLMNAVETWNRYLRFERDAHWLAEGRRRLEALEQKLDRLKSHQSRMEQHLGTPEAMRSLARDAATLGAVDEELSTTLLPQMLDAAFPLTLARADTRLTTADRSRGSPCLDACQAARTLLYALAASLERNHQDSWLSSLLPPSSAPSKSSIPSGSFVAVPLFTQAAHALAQAIDADVHGDYPGAAVQAQEASELFHSLHNAAGEERAQAERADALQSTANYAGCYGVAHALRGKHAEFAWIEAQSEALDAYCDPAPGSDAENNPGFVGAETLARARHYALSELRIRNMRGGAAVDSGDAEAAWRDYLATIREFYAGDYPALRLSGTLSGLEQVEQTTPRTRLALLLQQEHVGVLELTENRQLLPTARLNLAAVAIRAGSIDQAQRAMRTAQDELAANGGGKAVQSILAEVETALADAYLERGQADQAAKLLDVAQRQMAGEHNEIYLRNYAVARGQLALEQGHPEAVEPLLREALLEQERLGSKGGAESIAQAEQNRDLYAELAGVWLAEGRPGVQVLALWERYRLRILGIPAPVCADEGLSCLEAKLEKALKRPGFDSLVGQLVLPDRLLLYRASAQGVAWIQSPVSKGDVLAASERLERAVSLPTTSMNDADRAEQKVGELLLEPLSLAKPPATAGKHLSIEADPLLGNLPWPSVATSAGELGLTTDLDESPSLVLDRRAPASADSTDKELVVGASVAAGEDQLLPEALQEAREVARFGDNPSLLVGDDASQPEVTADLGTAAALHFAGHAAQQNGGTRLLLASGRAGVSAKGGVETPWLDSDMLRKHPPKAARLAVLSACSTGKKEAGWNHGMGDIVATLASLGVPDVVATRWQIDSSAAVPMMSAFYGGLAKGLTVPEALTAARQTMVRDPHYRHPYYWAAWYASGQGTSQLNPIFHAEK